METMGRLTLAALAVGLMTLTVEGGCATAGAEDFVCSVTSVSSGHILQINNSGTVELAVLDGIKCPWTSSADGVKAKAFTAERARGKQVRVTVVERRDKVAYVELRLPDGADLAELLLQEGLAIWNGKLGPRAERYHQLERDARKGKVGFWAAPQVTPDRETNPAQPPRTPPQQPTLPQPQAASGSSGTLVDEPSPLGPGTSTLVMKGKYQKDYSIQLDETAVMAERERRRKEQERAFTERGSATTQQGLSAGPRQGGIGGFGGRAGR